MSPLRWIILLLLGAMIVAGALLIPTDRDAPAPTMAAAPDAARPVATAPVDAEAAREFVIATTSGSVEIKRDGTWVVAKPGDVVRMSHRIRTGPETNATLRSSFGDELDLRENVELGVDSLNATVTELSLTRGKVNAEAAPGTERLEIRSEGTKAVAKAGTRFTIYTDDRGAVTVATVRGNTRVLAGGRSVDVGPNMLTHVDKGKTPRDPATIPDTVFLSVAWPDKDLARRQTVVRGMATPGSTVVVNGKRVGVDGDGKFVSTVRLVEGPNKLSVSVESIDGSRKEADRQVLVNTQGPPVDVDPSQLFGPKRKRD